MHLKNLRGKRGNGDDANKRQHHTAPDRLMLRRVFYMLCAGSPFSFRPTFRPAPFTLSTMAVDNCLCL